MVKAVVGEETRLESAEDRLSQSLLPSEVGLVIGKFSSALDRGFVFDLIATPHNDSGEPACAITESDKKKGSKPKSQAPDSSTLFIDKDWVAEHARQVSRMLVGGMKVVGMYIWVGDSAFKNSTIMLCQTVKGVAEAAPISETDWDERLLVHICYSPRRWNCRSCSLSSNITSSSLRPCDFKMGKVLSSLQTFKCMYNFNIRLPIFHDSASKFHTFSNVLHHAISLHAKELKGAKALIDGKLVVDREPCSSDGVHDVELLLPFMDNTSVEARSQKDVVGILSFSGLVCSFAYLNSKEPVSQAITDIKGDIITSLRSRLDIICDEADGDSSSNAEVGREVSDDISTEKPVSQLVLQLLRKGCALPFPRRVFAPWLAGAYVCDYLQPTETVEVDESMHVTGIVRYLEKQDEKNRGITAHLMIVLAYGHRFQDSKSPSRGRLSYPYHVLKDHCTELLSMKAPTDVSTILEPEKEVPSVETKSFWDVAVPWCPAIHPLEEKSKPDVQAENSSKSVKPGHVNVVAAAFILLLSVVIGVVLFLLKG